MEVSQEYIDKNSLDTKTRLANDLCQLLQVREKNEQMIKDWILFISDPFFKITPGEIYLSFQMAIRKELFDSKGVHFNLFPELSHNTTGEVIASYLAFKTENKPYQDAKKNLKQLTEPKKEITDSEKQKIRNEFLKTIYEDLKNGIEADGTWIEFERLERLGVIKISVERKKEIYSEEKIKYAAEQRELANIKGFHEGMQISKDLTEKIKSPKVIEIVKKRCWTRCVNDYLKNHLEDFETFKKAIS